MDVPSIAERYALHPLEVAAIGRVAWLDVYLAEVLAGRALAVAYAALRQLPDIPPGLLFLIVDRLLAGIGSWSGLPPSFSVRHALSDADAGLVRLFEEEGFAPQWGSTDISVAASTAARGVPSFVAERIPVGTSTPVSVGAFSVYRLSDARLEPQLPPILNPAVIAGALGVLVQALRQTPVEANA